jgi:O-antigen ligase
MNAIPISKEAMGRPDPVVEMDRLRQPLVAGVMVCTIVLWMLYTVTTFRLPTQPIEISDADASPLVRQLVFSLTGAAALGFLVFSRCLTSTLTLRLPMTALAGLLLFSASWSALPGLTVKRSVIFIFGLLGLIVLTHASRRPVHLMLRTIIYFTTSAGAVSLLLYLVLPSIHTVNPARPGLAGISTHPNTLAPFLSIGLILSLGLRPTAKGERRLLLLSRALLLAGLLLTASITSILATLLSFGFYLFLSAGSYNRGALQLLIIGGAAGISIIGMQTLKSSFFGATGRDESLSGRDQLWQEVWIECRKSLLVGSGYGAFWTEGRGRELVQTWNPRQSHNAYLDVILDTGVTGLAVVLILFPVRLLLAWRRICGPPGSPRRAAVSAMMAVAFGYMIVYAFGQSFFLRFDVFPFLVVGWITLLLTNPDSNNLASEFPERRSACA